MTVNELYSNFILCDGEIISCKIEFENENGVEALAVLKLKIRKIKLGKKYAQSIVEFRFSGLKKLEILEDFKSGNTYSDISLLKNANEEYYMSLDPYDNSNEENENDNFVIIANKLNIIEL